MATVLFIDDHTYSSRNLMRTLRTAGYDVHLAADADEAVRLFRLCPVDVVVLDCRLCRLTTPPADPAAVLRRLSPDTPIIMMASYCGVPCRQMQGADACVQKGDTGANLLQIVEIMLCARRYGLCRSVAA
jgi:CheY-like chemotaxis protein